MKQQLENARVAIVYDHLTTQYGGAELVLQVLLSLFPEAPLYTTVFDESIATWIDTKRVRTSFLQRLGWLKNKHQLLALLHPLVIEQFDFSEFDVVISVTAGVAKGVLTLPHQLHVSYVLTPTRYLSPTDDEQEEYIRSQGLLSIPIIRSLTAPLFSYLKSWDQAAAYRPDKIISISQLVSKRIKQRYGRVAEKIIYPPYIPFTQSDGQEKDTLPEFFLSLSRLVSYKRVDLSIKSCLELNKLLVVAGEGIHKHSLSTIFPAKTFIRKKSQSIQSAINDAIQQNKRIVFVGHCSEKEKQFLLSSCKALLMPGVEDFGLTALEASDSGVITILNAQSGVAEVLIDQKYSIHLQNKTVKELKECILSLDTSKISAADLKSVASNYTQKQFSEAFMNTLYQFWRQHSTISAVKLHK